MELKGNWTSPRKDKQNTYVDVLNETNCQTCIVIIKRAFPFFCSIFHELYLNISLGSKLFLLSTI